LVKLVGFLGEVSFKEFCDLQEDSKSREQRDLQQRVLNKPYLNKSRILTFDVKGRNQGPCKGLDS
jgi:hypothetical protein